MGIVYPFILPLTFSIDVTTIGHNNFKNKFKSKFKDEEPSLNDKTRKPKKDITVVISAHKQEDVIEKSIRSVFEQNYPLKNVYVSDSNLDGTKEVVEKLSKEFPNLHYWSKEGIISKGRKINSLVRDSNVDLGDYVYLIDGDVRVHPGTIEKLVNGFVETGDGFVETGDGFVETGFAAVTSFGYVTPPNNYSATYFHYGKEWANKLGKFRKTAQQYRRAMHVVCGASFMVKSDVLKKIEIPADTVTEDTGFTWLLQEEGYRVGFVPDAIVSSEDVSTLKSQIKQSKRWYEGTWQNLYLHRKNFGLRSKAKSLAYSTTLPGFIETSAYASTIISLPILAFFAPNFVMYFLIGDTILSSVSPLVAPPLAGESKNIPREFFHTLRHYHQITAYKVISSALWLYSGLRVCCNLTGKQKKWSNIWGEEDFSNKTEEEKICFEKVSKSGWEYEINKF